jgi:hypothetical protein
VTFDEVAALSVEGLNKSAISRARGIAWNTVARWLEKAAKLCRRFNDQKTAGFCIAELQAGKIRKEQPIWIFATIEVWPPSEDEAIETCWVSFESFRPNEFRTCPSDRYGRIRVLQKIYLSHLRPRVSLLPESSRHVEMIALSRPREER